MKDFASVIKSEFPSRKIVIVGDLVADQFLRGTISRVSREAPVFILRHDETETFAGGAANAAANVASLGANAVVVGIVGTDPNGDALCETLESAGVDCSYVARTPEYKTTTKVRVLAGQHYAPRQQVIRIDYENENAPGASTLGALKQNLRDAAADADAIILSDYSYGAADPSVGALARELAASRGIPLLVDSRFRLSEFGGATSATPNQEEVEQILGKNFALSDCAGLCRRLGFEALLVTRGNKGMALFTSEGAERHLTAIGSTEPVDVTGAGDTVIATYALGLACGLSFSNSAALANHAGGIVVMKKGTAVVSPDELLASLDGETEHGEGAAK